MSETQCEICAWSKDLCYLKCGHQYHLQCILQQSRLINGLQCPTCNAKIISNNNNNMDEYNYALTNVVITLQPCRLKTLLIQLLTYTLSLIDWNDLKTNFNHYIFEYDSVYTINTELYYNLLIIQKELEIL